MAHKTLADLISSRPVIGTDVPSSFAFSADGSLLVYLDVDSSAGDYGRYLACLNPLTMERRELLKPKPGAGDTEENLSKEEKLRRERQRALTVGVTSFLWIGSRDLLIPFQGSLYSLNPREPDPKLRLILEKTDLPILDARPTSDGKRLAFVRGGDLFACTYDQVVNTYSFPILVSYPPANQVEGLTNGLASFLAQEEMDRQHGYWWSPDGTYVAYERVDEREIEEYVIIHQAEKVDQEKHRYPFTGKKNPFTTLCLSDVTNRFNGNTDQSIILDLKMSKGETDVYLGRVDWFSKSELCVQLLNREQTRLELFHFDIMMSPPKKKLLLAEESAIWINLHELFEPLQKKGFFLWGSERSGFMHLYLYKINSTNEEEHAVCIRQITHGEILIEQIVGVNEETGILYFAGNASDPTERHLFKTSIFETSSIVQLTKDGTNSFVFDPSCDRFVLSSSSLVRPLTISLESLNSFPVSENHKEDSSKGVKKQKQIPHDLLILPPLSDDLLVEVQKNRAGSLLIASFKSFSLLPSIIRVPPATFRFTVDGAVLYSHVFIPDLTKFRKPFPTIVIVYGGPHVQRVKNDWYSTVDLRAQAYCSLGYLVVKCDNRGSARRGLAFEGKIKNNMGSVELIL